MTFSLKRFPDPILKQPTHQVIRLDGDTQRLIDVLIHTMRHHPRCVGLAAPQIGSRLRIAVMDGTGHPKVPVSRGLIVLVNPTITASEGVVVGREGCLSVPDLTANVQRSVRVHVTAQNRDGELGSFWLDGFEAIIAQHEIDHLDGNLFLDRVVNLATDLFRRKTYL